MPNAATSRHPLKLAGAQYFAVAQAVLVLQLAREHVSDDLHVAMAVHAKALAGSHAIFVYYP